MGGSATDTAKSFIDPSKGGEDLGGMFDPGGSILKSATGSDFANRFSRKGPAGKIRAKAGDDPEAIAAQKEAERLQKEKIARQKQKEAARLAAAESELGTRRVIATGGGSRSLLTATSARGVATLGGG